MNQVKFGCMVREFSFLTKLFESERLSHENVGNILVARGDRNLLEVTPEWQSHDIGSAGDYTKVRNFWFITNNGEMYQFSSSHWRTQLHHSRTTDTQSSAIGVQLMIRQDSHGKLQQVAYIIEVSGEDWSTSIEEWNVVVYKMKDFDWAAFSRGFDFKRHGFQLQWISGEWCWIYPTPESQWKTDQGSVSNISE